MLDDDEKMKLLSLARMSITHYLTSGENLKWKDFQKEYDPNSAVLKNYGCFVTLKTSSDDLRGCIGIIETEEKLLANVIQYAVFSATNDYRFKPVNPVELNDLHIEISVMGKVEPLKSVEDIVIGKHGLIAEKGRRRGLLLPQVAAELNWNVETFLRQTCLKAGLPQDSYLDQDTSLFYFNAFVFGEDQ